MNWSHFQTFCWLRWRLTVNQARRSGRVNMVLMMIAVFGALIISIPSFIGSFALGLYVIPKAEPVHLMYAGDGLVVALLFFWLIGLMSDLQRTEPLSLSKFLHLPVTVKEAFLINYLSSLVRLSLIIFVPVMLGFCLALVWVKGIALLSSIALLAAFVLMISALTYQFQGWLGALMSNPRRRRTVVVMTTMAFILIFQLPNLLNLMAPWGPRQRADQSVAHLEELKKLEARFEAGEFDGEEYLRLQNKAIADQKVARKEADRKMGQTVENAARLTNMILPIGWLPYGVMSAAEGRAVPPMLGLLGMTLIGAASLRMAYRTTINQHQGESSKRNGERVPLAAPLAKAKTSTRTRTPMLEARLPGFSEPVAVIALAGLRSLIRAPEAKMMLLTPVLMVPILGSMMMRKGIDIPLWIRPLIAIGAIAFVLLGMMQLACNQFGFDRDGFRVFVLSSARRRDILLGKNLSFAPLALMMVLILLLLIQFVCPMRPDHLLAMVPQGISMFLLFCIFANLLSIYAPLHVPAGAMKASNPKLSTVLLQLGMFMFLFPLTQAITMLPLGVEWILRFSGHAAGVPVYLLLSLAECAIVVLIYRVALRWQGDMFQSREQKILETVTNR